MLLPQSADHAGKPRERPRRISILGATGSIGLSTLDLIGRDPEAYEVVALTGGRNAKELARLATLHRAKLAVVADESCYAELRAALSGSGIETAAGDEAVCEAAAVEADWTMAAIVGIAGLRPTLQAVSRGTYVALANKECLVSAGSLFMAEVARHGATLLPVDSEHSAAFQVMAAGRADVERICLTASGGPFRTWSRAAMAAATPKQAVNHPNWSMGAKISIDSATLMNKGLELIEAHHLFALPEGQLEVLVHPQSIVHCLVYYADGSVLAQMSPPDMRTPIAYSLSWPWRMHVPLERLDLAKIGALSFEAPDEKRFPALRIAREALRAGGSASTVLNAANEAAVEAFMSGKLGLLSIAEIVEETIEASTHLAMSAPASVEDALAIDMEARHVAAEVMRRINQTAAAR